MHPWGKEVAVACRARCVHARLHSINGGVPLALPPADLPYLPGGFGSDICPSGISLLSWSWKGLYKGFLEQIRLSSGDAAQGVLEAHHRRGILAVCSLSNQALLPWALPHSITSISRTKQTGQRGIPVP